MGSSIQVELNLRRNPRSTKILWRLKSYKKKIYQITRGAKLTEKSKGYKLLWKLKFTKKSKKYQITVEAQKFTKRSRVTKLPEELKLQRYPLGPVNQLLRNSELVNEN